jgi:deoxycytidylate deaminase
VYYPNQALNLAMKNNHIFHLAAWARKRKSYVIGVNSEKNSSKFGRRYSDGTMGYHLHAEMDLIKNLKGEKVTEIYVARFTAKGGLPTMARPCKYCQFFLKKYGIKKVHYTNWDGQWNTMRL